MPQVEPHPGPAFSHRLHGALLRLFWKIVAPSHPRGWLDLHPVLDDAGSTAWLHCHGMERWDLPNLEICDVPQDLLGPGHGILMAIAGYMRQEKAIKPDETIGGHFNGEEQAVVHYATLRRPPEPQPGHENALRVVDIGEPATSRFPRRLFAAHLVTMASGLRSAKRREGLLRRAKEIHPGTSLTSPADPEESTTNPNNFFAWLDWGFALADLNREEEAISAFEEAVARWPCGATKNAEMFREGIAAGQLPPPEQSAVSRFWSDLDVGAVSARVQSAWPAARTGQ